MTVWTSVGLQAVQFGFVLGLSPLIIGILNRMKEFVQGKRGPSIFQMYRDLRKLINKERVIPQDAGLVYRVAPYVYFAAPLIVMLLIPVLTTFPLFMAFAGDMMAGGFILGMGAFFLLAGAAALGVVGPTARASGVAVDVRQDYLSSLYATHGDRMASLMHPTGDA